MGRRLRLLALALVVLVIVGGIALVLTTRPDLSDQRSAVDDAWTPLRAPLQQRYEQLTAVQVALAAAPTGADREITGELEEELGRWDDLIQRSDDDADAEAEVEAANALEDLAARLEVSIIASSTLSASAELTTELAEFQADDPPEEAVTAYNDAVREYEDTRDGTFARSVASIFGYDSRPTLVIGATQPVAP